MATGVVFVESFVASLEAVPVLLQEESTITAKKIAIHLFIKIIMIGNESYERIVKLNHNEILTKVNRSTGEFTELPGRVNNIPKGLQVFSKETKFAKMYENVNSFLINTLTSTEYRVVAIMIIKSEYLTNALDPLNDETPITLLAEELKVSRNIIMKTLDKLRMLGVFGSFEVTNSDKRICKKWILNPYISFKGKLISSTLIKLFSETVISKIAQP